MGVVRAHRSRIVVSSVPVLRSLRKEARPFAKVLVAPLQAVVHEGDSCAMTTHPATMNVPAQIRQHTHWTPIACARAKRTDAATRQASFPGGNDVEVPAVWVVQVVLGRVQGV